MKFVHCFAVLLVANPQKRIKLGAKTMRRMCKLRQRPMARAGLGALPPWGGAAATYFASLKPAASGATAVAAAAAARGLLKALLTLRLRPETGQELCTDSDTERDSSSSSSSRGSECRGRGRDRDRMKAAGYT